MKRRTPALVLALMVLSLVAAPVFADVPDAASQESVGQEATAEASVASGADEQAVEAAEPQEGIVEGTAPEGQATAATDDPAALAQEDPSQDPLAAPAEPAAADTAFGAGQLEYVVLDADALTAAVTGGEAGLTAVEIPSTVEFGGVTYRVTEVAAGAFMNCGTISSVTFESPSNLVAIREDAFAFMLKDGTVPATIQSLVLPASLEVLGEGAFHCVPVARFALEDGSQLGAIPDGFLAADGADATPGTDTEATTVWDYVTNKFLELTEPFPFTPTDVARACDCLVSVDLGDGNSLKRIGMGAFKNQTHLASVDFGTGGTARLTIARGAFVAAGNNGAASVTGSEALGGIDMLMLPANLVQLDSSSFQFARVKSLVFSDGCALEEIPGGFMAVDGGDAMPGAYAASGSPRQAVMFAASRLESVSFGSNNGLASIGSGAFKNQSHLTTIDFGTSNAESLSIEGGAFLGAGNNAYLVQQGVDDELSVGIKTLVLPANLKKMDTGCFRLARVLNLEFSDGCLLKELCDGFMTIDGGDAMPINQAVYVAASYLESVSFGQDNSLATIGYGAFRNQGHLTVIDFGTPANELSIQSGAFLGAGNNAYLVQQGVDDELCDGIETLVFPANLKTVGYGCFRFARVRNLKLADNSKLGDLVHGFMAVEGADGMPGSYADMPTQAVIFAASRLESVSFGQNNSLIHIGQGAFKNQSHLTSIDFGTSTAKSLSIENGAFLGAGNNTYLVEQGIDTELCAGIETLTLPGNLGSTDIPVFHSSYGIRFNDTVDVDYSDGQQAANAPLYSLKGTEYEYVLIDGYGSTEDWSVADLTGKVAICSRGPKVDDDDEDAVEWAYFYGKANAANALGAIATIVYGNNSETLTMNLTGYTGTNPVVFISQANGAAVKASSSPVKDAQGNVLYYTGTLNVHPDYYTYYTVNGIGNGAFSYSAIKNLEFADGFSLDTLADGSLQELDLMQSLVLGENCSLTELSGGVFSKCDELATVDLRDTGITTIGDSLKENPKLASVYFPESLEAVTWTVEDGDEDPDGKCPFYGCGTLNGMHFSATDPSGITFTDDVFQFVSRAGIVFVPVDTTDEAIEAYKAKLTAAGLVFGPNNWRIAREGRIFVDVYEPGDEGVTVTAHYDDINWLARAGISTGWVDATTGDRTYRPYANVARCDMAAFLYRLAGSPEFTPSAADKRYFSDVSDKTPHAKEIWWMAATGISKGWDMKDGTHQFRPYANIARCDMAAFLYRLAGSPEYTPTAKDRAYFSDVNAKTAHATEVWWLASTGVSAGWTMRDGTHQFRPLSYVARADMAAFLHRMDTNGLIPRRQTV